MQMIFQELMTEPVNGDGQLLLVEDCFQNTSDLAPKIQNNHEKG
jgi:hypothetical protein